MNFDAKDGPADATIHRVRGAMAFSFVVTLAAFILVLPVAYVTCQMSGIIACGLSALTCYSAGCIGLMIGRTFLGPQLAIHGWLVGMLFRIAVPLALVALAASRRDLLDVGMVYYVLYFYMIVLVTDVILALPEVASADRQQRN